MLGGQLREAENKRISFRNIWPKKWWWALKKFEWWSLPRELLKQYLTEKQNGCLRSDGSQEVVTNEKWPL